MVNCKLILVEGGHGNLEYNSVAINGVSNDLTDSSLLSIAVLLLTSRVHDLDNALL